MKLFIHIARKYLDTVAWILQHLDWKLPVLRINLYCLYNIYYIIIIEVTLPVSRCGTLWSQIEELG